MASPKFALLLILDAAALVASASAAEVFCRDTLGGLLACHDFMFDGALAASPACCDAYGAVFNFDLANGVYGRSTGYDVNVTHALQITTSCGQVQPPIELCEVASIHLAKHGRSNSLRVYSILYDCWSIYFLIDQMIHGSCSGRAAASCLRAGVSQGIAAGAGSAVTFSWVSRTTALVSCAQRHRQLHPFAATNLPWCHDSSVQMALAFLTVAAAMVAAVA